MPLIVYICRKHHPPLEALLKIQNGSNELLLLTADEILFIRSDGNYCVMTLSDGEEVQLWISLKSISELIDEQMRQQQPVFVRVGKQYVINLHYICCIDTRKDCLTLWRRGLYRKIGLDTISHNALSMLEEGIKQLKLQIPL